MAASGSVFSETLQEITNTKLNEISKRRSCFEEAKSFVLTLMQAQTDATKRLMTLSSGVKGCFDIKLDRKGKVISGQTKHTRLETELTNLDRFLHQARYDPSTSTKMLQSWEESLLRHLDMQSLKFSYATLYGQLVTEWLSNNKKEEESGEDGDIEMGEAFEVVGNAKKLETRMEWERMVFEPAGVDEDALEEYLTRLFGIGNKEKKGIYKELKELRSEVETFESQLSTPNQFTVRSLKWAIQGLYASDFLSDEKREVLKDFEGNDIILGEIADVLNMRLSALESWTWSSEAPVPVEMRRKINGIYNIHMHEDLLQAIFLQYIGVKWSVFFKTALHDLQASDKGSWTSTSKEIPRVDMRRLEYYLGPLERSPCLQEARSKMYASNYFMGQLLESVQKVTVTADGEEDADYELFSQGSLKRRTKQTARKVTGYSDIRNREVCRRPRISAPSPCGYSPASPNLSTGYSGGVDDLSDEEEEQEPLRGPMALKQNILHMLSTEIAINKRLYGEMTAFHSVFKSWNANLPHEVIRTVLKFFGVSETWLGFFNKFLEAPLRFIDDDKAMPGRKRRRGTPPSHVLSDVFGETTLFCLDLAINQSTSGGQLWRVQDDMWFWSRDHGLAVKAWKTIAEFAALTGTELNAAKSGTVRISKSTSVTLPVDRSLPDGDIRWGFLCLSPQTGRFDIDQTMVDSHIKDLSKQLHDRRKSIFDFIQTWNTYAATFFNSNFGKAGNCFGREHVDNMLAAHERIQRQVFAISSKEGEKQVSSVAEYLKKAIRERFGVTDVPDGYLYFPTELGGLDLQSPFVSLLQIRDEVLESPSELLDNFEQAERDAYERCKAAFLKNLAKPVRYSVGEPKWEPESKEDRETFMPFDEYVRYREEFKFRYHPKGTRLHSLYNQLMKRPWEKSLDHDDGKVWTSLSHVQARSNPRGITNNWHTMTPYWCWVAMMYGPEIVDRFGGLNIVDPGLLPMRMVSVFRDRRVKWQG